MNLNADSHVIREQHIDVVLHDEQLDPDVDFVIIHVNFHAKFGEKPQSKSIRFFRS